MDSRCRFLTLGIPWTQSMPSHDVNAVTRLAEASWRRDKDWNKIDLLTQKLTSERPHQCLTV